MLGKSSPRGGGGGLDGAAEGKPAEDRGLGAPRGQRRWDGVGGAEGQRVPRLLGLSWSKAGDGRSQRNTGETLFPPQWLG